MTSLVSLVKTGLCNEGVLAINIGIIDAGWSGPIKTLLINFGKNPYPLALGEAFLRLTFFQHQAGGGRLGGPIERSAYVQEARRSMLQLFSETFLDIETSAKKASEKTMEDFKLILFKYVPIAALLITLITFVLNYGSLWLLPRFVQPADISRAAGLEKSVEKLLDENRLLRERVESLERRAVVPVQPVVPTEPLQPKVVPRKVAPKAKGEPH